MQDEHRRSFGSGFSVGGEVDQSSENSQQMGDLLPFAGQVHCGAAEEIGLAYAGVDVVEVY